MGPSLTSDESECSSTLSRQKTHLDNPIELSRQPIELCRQPTELSRQPTVTRSLKALDQLFKQAKKRKFRCMATNKAYIEETADTLLDELDQNGDGKLNNKEIRVFCEKVIKKAAGVGWRFLTWKFIHKKCDEIFESADRNHDGFVDKFEFKIALRGSWLYLSGVSDKDTKKISSFSYANKEIPYQIVTPKNLEPVLETSASP